MLSHHQVRQEISVLLWLLRSRRKGIEVLNSAVEIVMGIVDTCYLIIDREAAERMVRSEMVSLLEGVATGEIDASDDTKFIAYLLNRYRARLVPNLRAAGAICEREEVSVPEEMEPEKFLDWLSFQQNCWETKEPTKKRRMGGVKNKTVLKELLIRRIQRFYPGCLAAGRREFRQASLFQV